MQEKIRTSSYAKSRSAELTTLRLMFKWGGWDLNPQPFGSIYEIDAANRISPPPRMYLVYPPLPACPLNF